MIKTDRWAAWRRFSYQAGSFLQYAAPALCTIFGVIATYPVDPNFKDVNPIRFHFYAMIHGNLVWIFLALLLVYIISIWLKALGDHWVVDKLQFVLDQYQEKAFVKKSKPDPRDYHRVTLFQYKKNVWFPKHWSAAGTWWPLGGGKHPFSSDYLVPVMRSGNFSKKTNAIFFVSDVADDAEGIAGWAWATGEAAEVGGLPSIGTNSTNRDLQEYAESTKSDEAMIPVILAQKGKSRRSAPLPRAIVAIPVERKNKPWGVVVLDSRDPEGIVTDAVANYSITIALISLLLERF